MLISVAVKTLAEWVHRAGDLYPSLGGRVTAEEGVEAQRRAQRDRGSGYEREVVVNETIGWRALELHLSGRVDGCDLTADPPMVEEIKATRADAADAERLLGSAHWAQATLYAALLARTRPEHDRWRVRLLYCHPDTHAAMPFERELTRQDLAAYLVDTVARYGAWMQRQHAYRSKRDAWLSGRPFPYGEFRRHQRALAGRVFQAFRDGEHLLLEAPTGSGKTMGVLFPALKALATGHVARLFFLTSRGTGALAAARACGDLAEDSQRLRVVDLVAKEKVCAVPGMPCDETCAYAVGYYDRSHDATAELLEQGHMSADLVRSVADAHSVCPFELSLDAARWADLIIGDYNYLLDPVVRLQRFADDGSLGVLIDESHQLADRTRRMLSVTLDRHQVRAALAESPPGPLRARIEAVDRALLTLRRSLPAVGEQRIDAPTGLLRAMERTVEALSDGELDLGAYPATRQLLFELVRWCRAGAWADDARFRYFAKPLDDGRGVRRLNVSLVCLDAAAYLETTLGGYGPHVRFSGTVSPLALYQAQHGQMSGTAERVAGMFEPEQLATLIVPDVPVYYRQRERTLPHLADLAAAVVASHPGNYLLAVPSFEYLERIHGTLVARHPELTCVAQVPGMDDEARAGFLAEFQRDRRARLGLIVLGGIFAESVDFNDAPLSGVICAGVGLPPITAEREAMAAYFDAALDHGNGNGQTVAYLQPAMTKVLQMAGRLLRGPDDRGVLCLVDDRFARAEYQRFFPRHWRPEILPARRVATRLEDFWRTGVSAGPFHAGGGFPRLRPTVDEPHDLPT